MIYVCAMTAALRGLLNEHCRLYAFPAEPETPPAGGFVILDSGAYGLSMQGGRIDEKHMRNMAEHYKAHGAKDTGAAIGIAPDEYLNPSRTMKNWAWWVEQGFGEVAPVIQCGHVKKIDLYLIRKQCDFYARFKPGFVAFSNPGLRGVEAKTRGISAVITMMRGYFPGAWIHNLGAGWDIKDVQAWREIGFDSIDSIAYYTAAQNGEAWAEDASNWTQRAINNARHVNEVINGSVCLAGRAGPILP